MKRLLFAIALLLAFSTVAGAFEVDGLYYYMVSESNKTVEVARGDYSSLTSITIPDTIIYENTTYSVTSIGNEAFLGCTS
ncbi:MAG: hypothetical protein IK092_01105, partial [Muribaculaceae bacterium]|nr:hypothetical protein [Muribaculaceae bacterium]